MTTPGQPLEIIHPNGQTVLYLNPYTGTYSASKSYARRMQRGYARGLSQTEARGHRPGEAALRRQAAAEQGETPWSLFNQSFQRRYGFSYSYWRYLRRNWIDRINAMTSKDGFGWIEASHISTMIQIFNAGIRDPYFPEYNTWQEWVEAQLQMRLDNTYAYQEQRDATPGRARWNQRNWVNIRGSGPPIEFYYYH